MVKSLKEKIENYGKDYTWDEKSSVRAFELSKFLFAFLNYTEANFSEKTHRKHCGNVSLIVGFEMSYGLSEIFEPNDLAGGTKYLFQLKRKVSTSDYGIQSYNSTWRQLDKFIESGDYKPYLEAIEAELKKD
jgi:hypothetical protein